MPRLPRAYWVLWTGALVNKLGAFVVPFLAIYLTRARGMPLAASGVVVSLFGAGALASSPVGGVLADRIGRRRTLLASSLVGATAMVHLGVARSPVHLGIAAALLGFCGDLYRPALQAATADLVAPALRARAYGYLHWAANLGFAFAAIVGGLVADVSFMLLFAADAATTLAFGALVLAYVPETRPAPSDAGTPRASLLAPYRDRVFLAFVALTLAVTIVFLQFTVALPLDMTAHGASPRTYGLLVAINGVLIVVVQPFAVRAVERAAPMRAMALAAILIGVGFGMTALATSAAGYAASIVVWTFGEIAMAPILSTVVAQLAPRDLRGSYQGVMGMSFGGSALVAPVVGTAVLGAYGGAALWGACVVTGVATAVGFLALGRARVFRRSGTHRDAMTEAMNDGISAPDAGAL